MGNTRIPSLFTDYVVEEGTETINTIKWTYRKWDSGIAECWGEWESDAFAPATAVGGFYGRVIASFYFPTDLFVATPQAFFNLYSWGTGYFWGQIRSTTATKFELSVWRNDNATSAGKGSIYAIGRWK